MISSIEKALVVDDDILMREFIVETLSRKNIAISQAGNGLEARKMLEDSDYDIAFIDLKMPGMDGMQLLNYINENKISTLCVMVTAFGTVEQAVEAMKIGAYDFLMKPFSPEQVELIIKRAQELVTLHAENSYLKEELGWKLPGGNTIIGESNAMLSVMKSIKQIAKSSSTVLISGESGTGKELVAQAIHSLSGRRNMPFIRMNCAAVPDSLMDSELFGHEKGAFTSAISRRLGRFELAHGGTLLLDEISEMKIELQAKLLRVLQEQQFERVGGGRSIRTDCRIVATTNRDFKKHIEEGNFRQDLYYRLNVLPIHIPALRERPEDIPVLANAFLSRHKPGDTANSSPMRFTSDAMDILCSHSWPGNIRELENLIERLCVMESGPELSSDVLPAEMSCSTRPKRTTITDINDFYNLSEIEKNTIISALKANDGNRQRTANLLGISIRTLRNKINLYRECGDMIDPRRSEAA